MISDKSHRYVIATIYYEIYGASTNAKTCARSSAIMGERMKSHTMSPCYIQKTVGPTTFYSCQVCPFMAIAEIDVKTHLFISHPELVKTISFLKDVRLQCPGCGDRFDSEASIRMHLRVHHIMGVKDMKKLLKTLITVALKNTNQETVVSSKKVATIQPTVSPPALDETMPLVIEISPDISTNEVLPSGISVISLDELQKLKTMSTPIEKDDPKKIIEEACINIVYIDERIEEHNYSITEQHIVKTPELLPSHSSTSVTSQTLCKKSNVPKTNSPSVNISNIENKEYSTTGLIDFLQSKDFMMKNIITAQPETDNNNPVELESNDIIIPVEFQMKDAISGKHKLKNTVENKSNVIDNPVELNCANNSEMKSLGTEKKEKRQKISPKYAKIKPYSIISKNLISEDNILNDIEGKSKKNTNSKEPSTRFPNETPLIETQLSDVEKLKCSYKDCNVSLSTPENMKYHSMCHQDNRLRCPECKQSFSYPANLHQHLWKRHDIDMDLYACDKCGYKTVHKTQLEKKHKMIHTTVKSHKCPTCSNVFKSKKQLSNHKATHIDTKFSCETCKREFKTEIVLRRHIRVVHENVKPYRCDYCEYSSSTNNDLRIHIRVHKGEKPFACEECPFKAADPKSLRRHRKVHSGNNKYNCQYCDYCCIQMTSLKNHILSKHEDLEEEKTVLSCPFCVHTSINRATFVTHLSKHIDLNEKSFSCEDCPFKAADPKSLRQHQKGHSGNNKYNCQHCDYCCIQMTTLEKHILSKHADLEEKETVLSCPFCVHTSINRATFVTHLSKHIDVNEKPFSCEECSFKATDPKSLRRHQKGHSGNNKYNCQHCDYCCSQMTSLKKHISSKHADLEENKTVLSCPFCVHTSINRDTFVTHLNKHIDLNEQKTEDKTKLESNEKTKSIENDVIGNPANEHLDKTFDDSNGMTKADSTSADVLIELDDNDTCHELTNACNTNLNDFNNEHIDLFTDSFFNMTPITTDLTQDDSVSECIVSESSNDTILEMMEPVQSTPRSLPIFVSNNSINIKQGVQMRMAANTQNNNHTQIMNSFPIRLPMNSQSVSNGNFRLTPFDKIPLPSSKFYSSQIRTSQMLTVPTHGTVLNQNCNLESIPRKKPKISVKSNLILKGPDKVNMFRLEDDEHHIESTHHTPITLNNLINRQLMQLNTDSVLVNPQGTGLLQNMLPYADTMLDSVGMPQGDSTPITPELFNFNQQEIDTTELNMMSHQMQPGNLVQCNNSANYIKLEAQQSFQPRTHHLDMYPDSSLLCGSDLLQDYCKTSPPLDEIHKNDNEIKNEVKSDVFMNLQMHKMQNDSMRNSPTINDSNSIDNSIGNNEIYGGHINLMVLPNMIDSEEQTDITELEDKKQNNYSMNFPMDTDYEYYPNNDYQLENDPNLGNPVYTQPGNISDFDAYTRDSSRVLTDMNEPNYDPNRTDMNYAQPNVVSNVNDFSMDNYVLERRDPMMNTTVRPVMTKINVKNIELMKNSDSREQH